MASVKVKFRASASKEKEGVLFYQVIHSRVVRQIHSGYKLYPHEWDALHADVQIPSDTPGERWKYLVSLREVLRENRKRLKDIIGQFECTDSPYTADLIVESYLAPADNRCFISFARCLIDKLRQGGKRCTADTYTTSMNSFARFRKERDIGLDGVNSDLMVAYENYLKSIGICPNSISFYMRNLRAIYNRAVENDLTKQRYPFKHVYTGIDKTVKRALPLNTIRQIREMDLSRQPAMGYARDLFMFSFYMRGMSFVDMAFLRKKDLQNGVLSYRRQKTGQQLFVKWEKPMQEIIDRYAVSETPYMLPIIQKPEEDKYRQYRNAAHLMNARLKKLGEQLGLSIPLTSYVARHAWASIAKSKNVSISVISEAMGHDSESTTRIYLASLDTSMVDEANSLILKLL